MNKTVNINLGGMFFHIDEDAYQKMTRYFDAIKRSLSNSGGQDEIIKDIEMRIGELITEKHTSDKQVINIKEVDEIITVMGQPEDYRIDGDETDALTNYTAPRRTKKLYRDTEKGMIGGVATGLGHYFGIDSIWIKIAFILFTWLGGTGIIAYLILWIVTPEAVTTSEKLEMTGEPVTISNIEKKVREEFENMSEKFKNANYDEMGNQVKTGVGKVAGGLGEILKKIFGVFAKILGVFVVVFSSVGLLAVCVASIILIFSSSLPEITVLNHINTPIGLETPLWIQGILFLLAAGIPLFFILILGLKLLITNLKSIGNIAKYSLLALWIIAIGIVISLGIKEASQLAFDGKVVQKETIALQENDTLFVKFRNNDYYSKDINEREDFLFTQDSANNELIYSNNVRFHVLKTDQKLPFLQIERQAEGKSMVDAKKRAEKIKYSYKIEGNQLVLDNYLLTEIGNKYRNQEVEIFLYLPEGVYFKPDMNVQNYDRSYESDFDLKFSSENDVYKVIGSELKCLNCIVNEEDIDFNNEEDVETVDISGSGNDTIKTITVKVGGKEIIRTETKKSGSLTVDENGVIIKTN
ncbi:PspC domain-containing protein [Flavobacterium sp.]|uniref:PspC domain-containing protein n=1 Tax=Flavobacterium sp. TaxID=239 RepID=UPI002B4B50F9|nr:PspC domain-containing protein [Flavobacterium sp.]HLF51719.1 PspC domain-containing protein [Flavobacterium sp.]